MIDPPTVLVHRLPRLDGAWRFARSWFGGLPRLGDLAWPRSDGGTPLVFLAQIDLSELAAAAASPLPTQGSLAFFLGTDASAPHAVLRVPESASPTPLPEGAVPCRSVLGGYPAKRQLPDAPKAFPRWPIGFTALDLPPGLDPDIDSAAVQTAQSEAVARHLPHRPYFLSAKGAWEAALGEAAPVWWACAQRYARQLDEAQLDAGRPLGGVTSDPGLLGRLLGGGPDAFDDLVHEVHSWVAGTDPWAPMPPADVQRLDDLMVRVRKDFRKRAHYRPASFRKDLQDAVLRHMLTAEDAVWERLPREVRQLVDDEHRLASGHWHQVFGFGCDVQGAAVWDHADDLLLLQLAYDDLMEWVFGDMGVFIFWITPEDAAAGDFSKVQATFEGS